MPKKASQKTKTKKVIKSAANGKFVSKEFAKQKPNETYEDTVPTKKERD